MRNSLKIAGLLAALLFMTLMAPSFASAQIVSLANNQGQSGTCVGGVGPGGTICAGPTTPFSLKDIDNGSEVLTIPDTSSTPEWYVKNDTGGSVSTVTLIFDGDLASNANLQCNFGGGVSGNCFVDGTKNGLNNPIPSGDIPVTIQFDLTTGLPSGEFFEINTASFAHAGQDFGCLAGTPIAPSNGTTCQAAPPPAPEPATLSLLLSAMLILVGGIGLRQRLTGTV